MPRPLALAVSLLLSSACGVAHAAPAALVEGLDMSVPQAPLPLQVEGRHRLVYELHLTQFGGNASNLSTLQVIDADSGAELAGWAGADLAARTRVIGRAALAASTDTALRPGERAVVYLEFDPGPTVPKRLRHRLGFVPIDSSSAEVAAQPGAGPRPSAADAARPRASLTIDGAALELPGASAPTLAPPLRGGPWVAIYAPQWPRGHRRVFYALNGRARLPGRHAIDWVRVDERGRIARGDADIAAHHLGYGAPVLAVADARVAALRDGQPESATVSANPRHALDQAAGNYVVLALADGRYATYEHLRPGSIAVREGEAVRVGQVIGELGFSGDSTGPHLHFHVADGPEPLASEGLPYGLDGFRLLGHYPQIDRLGSQVWQGLSGPLGAQRVGELPGSNAVVQFPR